VPRSPLCAQDDSLRRVALARPGVTTCSIVTKRSGRLRDIACANHACCTHHDLLGAACCRLRDSSVNATAYDTKLRRRGDTVPAILSGRPSISFRSRRSRLARRTRVASITLVAFVALDPAARQGHGRDECAGQDGRSFHDWSSAIGSGSLTPGQNPSSPAPTGLDPQHSIPRRPQAPRLAASAEEQPGSRAFASKICNLLVIWHLEN
jgi:hypothetical protein